MLDHVVQINRALKSLNTVARTKIDELTDLAKRFQNNAEDFISLVDAQMHSVSPNNKLPYIYLMDSILKNIPQHYNEIISLHISDSFMHIFTMVDERTRISLYKLFVTWLYYLPSDLLQELSDRVRYYDPYWPPLDIYQVIQIPEKLSEFRYGPYNMHISSNKSSINSPKLRSGNNSNENLSRMIRKRPIDNFNSTLNLTNSNSTSFKADHRKVNVDQINNLQYCERITPSPSLTEVKSSDPHSREFANSSNIATKIPSILDIHPKRVVNSNESKQLTAPTSVGIHGHINPRVLPPHLRMMAFSNTPTITDNCTNEMGTKGTLDNLKNIVNNLKHGNYSGMNSDIKNNMNINNVTVSNIEMVSNASSRPDFSLIRMDKNTLKIYNEMVVRYHLNGRMCSSCGQRFNDEIKDDYSNHLDWHFQTNRRRFSSKLSQRTWFKPSIMDDFNQSKNISITNSTINIDIKQNINEKVFDKKLDSCQSIKSENTINISTSYAPGKITFTDDPEINKRSKFPSCMAIFDKKDDDMCAVCKEKFDQFWNEELEEWHYEQAVRINEIAYHITCQPKHKSEEIDKVEEVKKNMDFTKLSSLDMSVFLRPKK